MQILIILIRILKLLFLEKITMSLDVCVRKDQMCWRIRDPPLSVFKRWLYTKPHRKRINFIF